MTVKWLISQYFKFFGNHNIWLCFQYDSQMKRQAYYSYRNSQFFIKIVESNTSMNDSYGKSKTISLKLFCTAWSSDNDEDIISIDRWRCNLRFIWDI